LPLAIFDRIPSDVRTNKESEPGILDVEKFDVFLPELTDQNDKIEQVDNRRYGKIDPIVRMRKNALKKYLLEIL
jgi:hypothetical protein